MSRPWLAVPIALAGCGHAPSRPAAAPHAAAARARGAAAAPAAPVPAARDRDDVCAHPEAALEMPTGRVATIDVDGVLRALAGHRGQLRRCYERYLKRDAGAGRVIATLAIGDDGRVSHVQVQGFGTRLDRCLCDVVARVQFPAPRGTAIVSYPMQFSD